MNAPAQLRTERELLQALLDDPALVITTNWAAEARALLAVERKPDLAPPQQEWQMTDELFRQLELTLQYYGQHGEARMGARTGGVMAGCPRGAPYIDQGEYADKAQLALQEWARKCREARPPAGEKS